MDMSAMAAESSAAPLAGANPWPAADSSTSQPKSAAAPAASTFSLPSVASVAAPFDDDDESESASDADDDEDDDDDDSDLLEVEEVLITPDDTSAAASVVTTTTAPTMTPALPLYTPAAPAHPAAHGTALLAAAPTMAHPVRASSGSGAAPATAASKHVRMPTRAATDGKQTADPAAGPRSKKPLTLLELPVDVLRLVVKEIHHTNDLTALALANSTLYSLAIPHIYSRFDIIWPDPSAPPSDGKTVDALTYGLSTLSLGSAFARTIHRLKTQMRHGFATPGARFLTETRFGATDYAKYTRKFSLGNGPAEWISEYKLNKESGKMLGTLVALSVAKMANLENFVWDMPTGVVSDVFMALASLPDHDPQGLGQCKLERLWIRWHNNSEAGMPNSPAVRPPPFLVPGAMMGLGDPADVAVAAATTTATPAAPASAAAAAAATETAPAQPPAAAAALSSTWPYSATRVEFPTFSVVPPVRSLTVLDIDELAYLDEMAVLVERSKDRLTELRVSIAAHARDEDFVQTLYGPDLQQVDLNATWPGESRLGSQRLGGVLGVLVGRVCDITSKALPRPDAALTFSGRGLLSARREKLRLATLELCRVPLCMAVCNRAFDWTTITTLTLLSCDHHETLWRQLKHHFNPLSGPRNGSLDGTSASMPQYQLALKHIHTDTVSKPLLTFIRDTLAPDSLEVLFLQNRRRSDASKQISVQSIFKNAVKPHRSSLRKLLINGLAVSTDMPADGFNYRRPWVLTSDLVTYLTSGRMANLTELAISINYRDWHYFLQKLSNLPQLLSLHIQHIAQYTAPVIDESELAMQIAVVATLCPEMRLCFVGIAGKCFEVVEATPGQDGAADGARTDLLPLPLSADAMPGDSVDGTDTSESEEEDDDDDDDDDVDDVDDPMAAAGAAQLGHESAADSDDGSMDVDSDDDSFTEVERPPCLHVREIFFYDDKVAIFKARRARL